MTKKLVPWRCAVGMQCELPDKEQSVVAALLPGQAP